MSGWVDDFESAYELADEEVKKLLALDRNNELLPWWLKMDGIPDPFKDEEDRLQKFKDKYWDQPEPWKTKPGVMVGCVTMSNYYFAVKAEVERIKLERNGAKPA